MLAASRRASEWFDILVTREAELLKQHPVLLRRFRVILLLVTLIVASRFALGTLWQWALVSQHPLSLDFSIYRASAIQGMQFGWNHLYDLDAQRRVYDNQAREYPSLGTMLWAPNVYTPPMSWLVVPFTFLPVLSGYLIWSILIFATTAFAVLTLAPGSLLAKVVQLALFLCPELVLLSLQEGQVTSFQIAAIAACWLLLKRGHDTWAGLALVPLVLKPTTLLLVPVTLLAAGRLRVFSAWLIATGVIGLAVLATIGIDGTVAYIHRIQYASSNPTEYLLGPWYNLTLHFSTRLGRLSAEVLAGALTLWVGWRYRNAGPEIPLAAGLVGSLLVASYLHLNDLLTLFPAGWLILRANINWSLWVLVAGGYLITVLSNGAGIFHWGEGLLLLEIALLVAPAVLGPSEGPVGGPQQRARFGAPLRLEPVPAAQTQGRE